MGERRVTSQWLLPQATRDFGLTPEEQHLYQHHVYNMNNGMEVRQPDGSVSTILQAVVDGPNGKFYNIPTVWGGEVLPIPEALQAVQQTGGLEKWPSYATPEEADQRYMAMHGYMDRDIGQFLGGR